MAANGTQAVDRAALLISTVVQADEPLVVRRPAGGLRPAEVHDVADARPPSSAPSCSSATTTGSYVAGSLFWLYAARHDPR